MNQITVCGMDFEPLKARRCGALRPGFEGLLNQLDLSQG